MTNPTSGGREGFPTWELGNWQVRRLWGTLVVCVLICGSCIRVLAILPLVRGLLLLPLLGHPGRANRGGGRTCRPDPPPPKPGATSTPEPHLTFSAHPRYPQSLLPHCPVLLQVEAWSMQGTCLVTLPPSLSPKHRCRHANPQPQLPSRSSYLGPSAFPPPDPLSGIQPHLP